MSPRQVLAVNIAIYAFAGATVTALVAALCGSVFPRLMISCAPAIYPGTAGTIQESHASTPWMTVSYTHSIAPPPGAERVDIYQDAYGLPSRAFTLSGSMSSPQRTFGIAINGFLADTAFFGLLCALRPLLAHYASRRARSEPPMPGACAVK
jgi:hypothetical protein